MQIHSSILDTRNALKSAGKSATKIVFVPTMGNLHEGHLALVRKAKYLGDFVVVSIFVNRLQFAPNEDFDQYPRSFSDDCAKLKDAGVDLLFAPTENDLYPEAQTYLVDPPHIQNELEGEFRTGHFRGVATVVLKLFNIVQPQIAVFGKKDYQQLMVLKNMSRQLALPIEIVAGETVRAPDGLALSSRNAYLTKEERVEAPTLYRKLQEIKKQIQDGNRDFLSLENAAKNALNQNGWKTDYIAIRNQDNLQKPKNDEEKLVILAASFLGKPRLIDNLEV